MAYPVEAPSIPPPWTVEDVRSFLVGYGRSPRELTVTQLRSWWFNLVLRVEADGETLVLRRYGVTPPEEVRWELAVLAHLRQYRFPTLAPMGRSNAPGDGLSEFLGKPAILYPYVEGHSGRDLDWLAALVPTTEVVARLHALTENLALPFPRVRSGTESRRIVRQLLDLAAERGVATHEPILGDVVTRAQRALASFEARLTRDGTDLPRSVVHHDAHRGNLLFRDGQLVALIDFDDAHYGYQVADVAVMVENWAGEGEPEGRLSLDKAMTVVDEYQRHRKLTDAERELLPDFVRMYVLCEVAEHVRSALGRGVDVTRAVSESGGYSLYVNHVQDDGWLAAFRKALADRP